MARYGQEFKDTAVARLMPPESASVPVVPQPWRISVAALKRWRARALDLIRALVQQGRIL